MPSIYVLMVVYYRNQTFIVLYIVFVWLLATFP